MIVQLTLNEGRTVEAKKAFYQAVADGLHERVGLRREDVFISLVEVKKEAGRSATASHSTPKRKELAMSSGATALVVGVERATGSAPPRRGASQGRGSAPSSPGGRARSWEQVAEEIASSGRLHGIRCR